MLASAREKRVGSLVLTYLRPRTKIPLQGANVVAGGPRKKGGHEFVLTTNLTDVPVALLPNTGAPS